MERKFSPVKWGIYGILGLVAIFSVFSTFFAVDSGEIVVYQNAATETLEVYATTGYHMAMPFTSKKEPYNKYVTISLTGPKGQGSYVGMPVVVQFPDNYTGTVAATFRFELPTDTKSMLALHRAFRDYNGVVNKLLLQTATDVMLLAATQFTSEDFFQGGLPKYKADLRDFLNNGTPVMEKRRVEIKTGSDFEGPPGKQKKKRKQFAEIFVPRRDAQGRIVRSETPLKAFGIRVTQVTMGGTEPADDLKALLKRTKEIFAKRRELRAEQENERQARVTAKLKGQRATEEAEQKALLIKRVAVVQASKKTALAQQEKERVLVVKGKQLATAKADLGIQRAKFAAAILEAKSVKVIGFANAEVMKAEYKARQNPVYFAELNREVAIKVSENMKGIKITMPQMVFGSGGKGGNDSMSLINALIAGQIVGKELTK